MNAPAESMATFAGL